MNWQMPQRLQSYIGFIKRETKQIKILAILVISSFGFRLKRNDLLPRLARGFFGKQDARANAFCICSRALIDNILFFWNYKSVVAVLAGIDYAGILRYVVDKDEEGMPQKIHL